MADFPNQASTHVQSHVIGTGDVLYQELVAVNPTQTTFETNTGAWPSANLAIFVPFAVTAPYLAAQMTVLTITASGNIDVGIYTRAGVLAVSKGSTAHAGSSSNQNFDITDTVLNPGAYYMAVALDNTTGIIAHFAPTAINARMLGVLQMAAAFPLPATATFAAMAQVYVPEIFITGIATI